MRKLSVILLFTLLTVNLSVAMKGYKINKWCSFEQYREYSTQVLNSVQSRSDQEKDLLNNLVQSILNLKLKHRYQCIGNGLKAIWEYYSNVDRLTGAYFLINADRLLDYEKYDLKFDEDDSLVRDWIKKIRKVNTYSSLD